MKSNFSVVFKYSILNKIKSKSFKSLTIMIFIISVAVSFVPALFAAFDDEVEVIGVTTQDAASYEVFESIGSSYLPEYEYKFVEDPEKFKEEDFIFVIDIDKNEIYSYSGNLDFTQENNITLLLSSYNTYKISAELNLTQEEVNSLLATPEIELVNLGEKQGSIGAGSSAYIFNFAVTILGMMILMFGSQFIGQEIMEEKTTRAMEVIMTSIDAGSHMLAKIFSNLTFMVIIAVEAVTFSFIGNKITILAFPETETSTFSMVKDIVVGIFEESGSGINMYVLIVAFLLLIFITMVTLFTFVAAIASSVTTVEEFQNSFGMATSLIIVCYMISLFVTNIDIRIILSYVPIMNFFMIPGLALAGNIGITTIAISLVISILFYVIVYVLSVKLYRVGVLNYSAKGVLKVLKQAFLSKN